MAKKDREIESILKEDILEDLPQSRGRISSCCTLLDLVVSGKYPNGGFPLGRVSHIYGAESTCKSVLAMLLLGWAQRHGMITFYNDVERTFDPEWAKTFGLDAYNKDTFSLGHSTYIETFFDDYLSQIVNLKDADGNPDARYKVVVTDSLSAMPSNTEMETRLDDPSFGATRAKAFSAGFRKYVDKIAKNNIALICIDQTRINFNGGYGADKRTTSGGEAIKFYSSVRVDLRTIEKIKNNKDIPVGIRVLAKTKKNKTYYPFKEAAFDVIWNYGLDNVTSNLLFIKEYKALADTGKKVESRTVEFNGKSGFVGKMVAYVEENNLEEKLSEEVVRIWNLIYAQDDRKKIIYS